jgi:murein L,D-transpeptidase YcbB/YkuD
MMVLRVALLVLALAGLSAPAFARLDLDELERTIALSPQAEAVRGALDEAVTEDPIEEKVLDGVRTFYQARNYDLLWLADRSATRQMTALRRMMDQAESFGLDSVAYLTPDLAPTYPDDPQTTARADVEFSRVVARFVTHIASGRVPPAEISRMITLEPERPDIGEALTSLSQSSAVAVDLGRYEPSHEQYRKLRAALSKLRASPSEAERIVVPEGDLMKPGKADARVPLLRQRLGTALAEGTEPDIYDEALVDAVKLAQAEAELTPDGIVGPRTLAVLNGRSREDDISTVIANLERWRWMPRDLGAFHIMVNVPEFMVRVVNQGAMVHEARVIVGMPTNPTPIFTDVMDYLVVNPYWNVPASIVSKEMLPAVRSNPTYFSRGGYEVFARVGDRFRQIDPYWVNWGTVSAREIQVRQVPGDFNALGRIKFMFPNKHSVYMHDTPGKKLFQRDYRALSHGCVRVQNPLDFADAILPVAAPDWNSKRLEKLFGGAEQRVNFSTPIPVHLAYFTARIGPDGALRVFEDTYGYDAKIIEHLAEQLRTAQILPQSAA